ncbi:hypothetical protein H6501_01355 [Candidatus Woesearchaeota archaeon]|nr:hypothetical protein [Nanoarchaeota archaeon]MCB9370223.1 hypothetical protein [Candidatus Woesearchaeota archaeon]USN44748.1 MAG: hypothetical protein H6500_02805 [Candidatus Woesearchaeota archaeon]
MEYKEGDFIYLNFTLRVGGKLVDTTNEALAKEEGLKLPDYSSKIIILGRSFIHKALDTEILEKKVTKGKIELEAKDAYGLKKKELIRTFPFSVFREQKMNPVAGMEYDFGGMTGLVKTVSRSRVLVDFNHPYAGKDFVLDFEIVKKVENILEKIKTLLVVYLRIPQSLFSLELKEKTIVLSLPEQVHSFKQAITNTCKEFIPEFSDFKLDIENFKKN